MSIVRYVCLSDLHLGEEDSVLTNLVESGCAVDHSCPSAVMVELVECLKEVIQKTGTRGTKPTLILNGDVLELALCDTHTAAMVFERFIELVMRGAGESVFDRIFFVPGNHDHHLWEMARETQYVDYIKRHLDLKDLPAPWHTTTLFVEEDRHPVTAYFLDRLIQRFEHLKRKTVHVAYPNLGILNEDASRCLIFHHGHFAESIYWLMSEIKGWFFPSRAEPLDVWDIEAENFAWIDFFWSVLGRSGYAGSGLETVYEKLLAPEAFRELNANVASSLAKKLKLPVPERLRGMALEVLFNWLVKRFGKTERTKGDCPMSEDGEKMLRRYVEGPLRRQIAYRLIARNFSGLSELSPEQRASDKLAAVTIPEMILVYGHTHKPFWSQGSFKGFGKPVQIHNTGGWVVDTLEVDSCRGGSVILVDENLNVASIGMYREQESRSGYRVRVEGLERVREPSNEFLDHVRESVNPGRDPWKSFSAEVAKAVNAARERLRKRVYTRIGS